MRFLEAQEDFSERGFEVLPRDIDFLRARLPEILHADISTISTFRRLKGDFRVGRRACMCQVSNSMQCLRAEMSRIRDSWSGLDRSDWF